MVSWLLTLGQVRSQRSALTLSHQGQDSLKEPSLPGPHMLHNLHPLGPQTPLPLLTSSYSLSPWPLALLLPAQAPLCAVVVLRCIALLELRSSPLSMNSDCHCYDFAPHAALTAHPTGPPVIDPHPTGERAGTRPSARSLVSPTLGHWEGHHNKYGLTPLHHPALLPLQEAVGDILSL